MTEVSSLTIGQLLARGGTTMVPIYLCSIATLAVFLRKFVEYRRYGVTDLSWFQPALTSVRRRDYQQAALACQHVSHPGAAMVAAMVTALAEQPDQAEAEGRRVGSSTLRRIERGLPLLSFLAQVAPLLGLLGTVIGMVDMFIGLQGGGTANIDIAVLAGGIWKALLTTAAGLCVAVPALAAYSYLSSRADDISQQLSELAQQILYQAGAGPAAADTA